MAKFHIYFIKNATGPYVIIFVNRSIINDRDCAKSCSFECEEFTEMRYDTPANMTRLANAF